MERRNMKTACLALEVEPKSQLEAHLAGILLKVGLWLCFSAF